MKKLFGDVKLEDARSYASLVQNITSYNLFWYQEVPVAKKTHKATGFFVIW